MFAKGRDRWDEALRDLRRAHHLNPNDDYTLSQLGWAEMAAGNLECGLDYLHQALRNNPRDPVQYGTHHYLAQAYFSGRLRKRATGVRPAACYCRIAGFRSRLHVPRSGASRTWTLRKSGLGAGESASHCAGFHRESIEWPHAPFGKPEHRNRFTTFLRRGAPESPSAADCLRERRAGVPRIVTSARSPCYRERNTMWSAHESDDAALPKNRIVCRAEVIENLVTR